MRHALTALAGIFFGCGGAIAPDAVPPPPGDASAETADASSKPLDCSHLDQCLDGGCASETPQEPIVLVKGQLDVTGLATDGANVYWASNQAGGAIMECSIGGCGGKPSVFASSQPNPLGVAVDGGMVYWLDGPNGAIMKCAGGTECAAPVSVLSGLFNPWNTFGVGDGFVYFAVMGGPVTSCPVSGGPYKPLAPIAQLDSVTVGGANVFWRDGVTGDVKTCDAASCTSATTRASQQSSGPIAANACAAYWTVGSTGTVMTCPSTGCNDAPTALAPSEPISGFGVIAVDDSGVYWATASGIVSCDLGGCAQTRLVATTVGTPTAIALDAANVYWATKGAVWKAPK